jgi:hypothetical protein
LTALQLAGLVLLYAAITTLPVVAGIVVAVRLHATSTVWLVMSGFTALGACGFIVYWVAFFAPQVISAAAWLLGVACAVVLALGVMWQRRRHVQIVSAVRELAVPLMLVSVLTLAMNAIGLEGAGLGQPSTTMQTRFLSLPIDNTIPLILANAVRADQRPLATPLYGDWLAGDRPPLQSGIVLFEDGLTNSQGGQDLAYQVIASLLQSLWLLGMWALLSAAGASRRAMVLVILVCASSGFVLVNTLFAWPKLVAAAFLLPVVGALLFQRRPFAHPAAAGVLLGAMAGFSLLFHGTSVFGLIAVALMLVLARLRLSLKLAAAAAGTIVVLQGSWMLYQHFGSPPGDRLLKWQLAGVVPIDGRTTVQALRDSYGSLGVGGTAHQKLDNLLALAGDPLAYVKSIGGVIAQMFHVAGGASQAIAESTRTYVVQGFYYVLESAGLIGIAGTLTLPALLWKRARNTREARIACTLLPCSALGLLAWCLVMYGPPNARTVVHQGSYLLPLLFMAGATLLVYAVNRILAWAIAIISAVVALAVYAWLDLPALPQGQHPTLSLLLTAAACIAVSVGVLVAWLRAAPNASGESIQLVNL